MDGGTILALPFFVPKTKMSLGKSSLDYYVVEMIKSEIGPITLIKWFQLKKYKESFATNPVANENKFFKLSNPFWLNDEKVWWRHS